MPTILRGDVTPQLPYAERVRLVAPDQAFVWLAAGWRDFTAALGASFSYGLLFSVIGAALTYFLTKSQHVYMLLPLAAGFMLLGPVLTIGFQAISRDLEQYKQPSFATALFAWRRNPGAIIYAALAFMFLFLVFIRLSEILFALTFPASSGPDVASLLHTTFFTAGGLQFLALFVIFGACVAALAFAGGAFALPMMIDRDVGVAEAVATSFTAVIMNLRAMALWAILLVALVAAGMAMAFIGLAVTLPVAGHAAWHAYRETIRS